jgi:hypothetical protein
MDQDLYERARAPFDAELERLRPPDLDLIDVHTHLGLDEDGRSLSLVDLLATMDLARVGRSFVFPLHDPERHPAYRLPNDRVLAWANESAGRLVPFCRLDPAEDAVAEGRRALAAGARGIKLHPRAQAFGFKTPEADAMFGLAEEAQVPMLIHAGRGLPPIGDDLADLILGHPDMRVILAHAGTTDMSILTRRLADHPGVVYDTAVMFSTDVIDLFSRVGAERVVFGSDPPYGWPAPALYLVLRVMARLGATPEQVAATVGGTAAALLDGGKPLPAFGPPLGDGEISIPATLMRASLACGMVVPSIFRGDLEWALMALDMALSVCRSPRAGAEAEAFEMIAPALEAAQTLLRDAPEEPRGESARAALDLLHRAMTHAATVPVSSASPVSA